MARRNGHSAFKGRRNKGQHQRRRSSRGGRLISKLFTNGEVYANPNVFGKFMEAIRAFER